jgi:hypothetical protein
MRQGIRTSGAPDPTLSRPSARGIEAALPPGLRMPRRGKGGGAAADADLAFLRSGV